MVTPSFVMPTVMPTVMAESLAITRFQLNHVGSDCIYTRKYTGTGKGNYRGNRGRGTTP